MPSLLYITIRRLASSVEICNTLSYDIEINTIVTVFESGIYIEQMYYSFYLKRQLPHGSQPNYMCVYILFRITHYQITTPVRSGVNY